MFAALKENNCIMISFAAPQRDFIRRENDEKKNELEEKFYCVERKGRREKNQEINKRENKKFLIQIFQ